MIKLRYKKYTIAHNKKCENIYSDIHLHNYNKAKYKFKANLICSIIKKEEMDGKFVQNNKQQLKNKFIEK